MLSLWERRPTPMGGLKTKLAKVRHTEFLRALRKTGGNVAATAMLLGVSRPHVYNVIRGSAQLTRAWHTLRAAEAARKGRSNGNERG